MTNSSLKKAWRPGLIFLLCAGVLFNAPGDSIAEHGFAATFPLAAAVSIQLEPVLTAGLANPLYLTHARDGSNRLFVVEQPGRIKVLQPGGSASTVFLDITSRVLSGGERGLLGLAFHPQFSTNRRFFVNYTRRNDGATVVAEYRVVGADPNVADSSETVLLTIAQPFSNHNGGMIEFGPDGFLYVATGDGGSANDPGNRAQNIEDLLGKILRIDVDKPETAERRYSSPPDNPFFGPAPGRDEIFATGLRNPWRFSFDRGTGALYAGDVGQNAIEEIDVVNLGGNYGWRVFEGTRCTNNQPASSCIPSNYVPPVFEYPQAAGRCSVTGGYVYRGTRFTLPYGAYVFGDYCTGEILLLQGSSMSVLLDTTLSIASFGEDEAGEIYVVGLGGTVHRILNAAPPALTSYYFPRLVTAAPGSASPDGGDFTGIAVANFDGGDATLRLTALSTEGESFAGPGLTNPAMLTLRPGQQIPSIDVQLFGQALASRSPAGWMRLDSTTAKIGAFFLAFNSALTLMDGADVSVRTLRSAILPEIEEPGFTRVHIANPDSLPANVTFELLQPDGTPRTAPVTKTVKAQGATAEFLSGIFPGLQGQAGDYLRLDSDRGVAAFEFLGSPGQYAYGLNGQDTAAGATTLYAPQYAVEAGRWATALSIINLDQAPGQVAFELFGDDGKPIGPVRQSAIAGRGKIRISDPKFFVDAGTSLLQGYIRITSNGPRLSGSIVFGDPSHAAFASALPLVDKFHSSLVYSQLASDQTYFTGLAVLNPADGPAEVTIDVYEASGNLIASKTEVVPARGRTSRLLIQFFPALTELDRGDGYFRVTADRGIASFALFGTRALTVLSAIPPQPAP